MAAGDPKIAGKWSNPRLLGAPINFHKISFLIRALRGIIQDRVKSSQEEWGAGISQLITSSRGNS